MDLRNKRILVLAPHPDDEAIGCGGLIMNAASNNAKVFVLFFSVGTCRQLVTGTTDAKTRLKEAANASAYAGYDYKICYNGKEFMHLDAVPVKDMVDMIEDEIELFKPDIILLPTKESYNQDHRAVYYAAIAALRPIPRNIRHFVKTVLVYEEPYQWNVGNAFKANLFIDISDYLDKKLELLLKYKTQNRDDPFPRSQENLTRLAGLHGSEVGIKYAEGYQVIRYCD
jgi:LmbE family N-acetylglucosaminyl deacetylase